MRERRTKNEQLIDAMARRYGRLPSELLRLPLETLAVDFACFRAGIDAEQENQ